DHLRADEHVDGAGAESGEERVEGASATNRIAIEPRDTCAGTNARHLGFDALGPEPRLLQVGPGATRTFGRDPSRVIAVVTARARRRPQRGSRAGHPRRCRPLAVDDQGHAAVRALERPGTLPAKYRR